MTAPRPVALVLLLALAAPALAQPSVPAADPYNTYTNTCKG